ncbi:hypothetical protein BDD12DRAFT_469505 [Trichophaea hybrida]|nr:hypothetical protein BDD12DRAFT_469505 [Trichophaea hybrida]
MSFLINFGCILMRLWCSNLTYFLERSKSMIRINRLPKCLIRHSAFATQSAHAFQYQHLSTKPASTSTSTSSVERSSHSERRTTRGRGVCIKGDIWCTPNYQGRYGKVDLHFFHEVGLKWSVDEATAGRQTKYCGVEEVGVGAQPTKVVHEYWYGAIYRSVTG